MTIGLDNKSMDFAILLLVYIIFWRQHYNHTRTHTCIDVYRYSEIYNDDSVKV